MTCYFSYTQNIQITGTVTDGNTGEPVAYASIRLKGTTVGTATDLNGNYTINATTNGTLVFSFIGYTTQEIVIALTELDKPVEYLEIDGLGHGFKRFENNLLYYKAIFKFLEQIEK